MRIEHSMKTFVISIDGTNTVRQAAGLMIDRHVGTLPVVDEDGKLLGLLTVADVLELFMPDFVKLLDEFDFVTDFGVMEEPQLSSTSKEVLEQQVSEVMSEPISIVAGTGLLRAFRTIDEHDLLDVPVVDEEGQLIGIASRVDIGTAFLTAWLHDEQS